MEMGADFTVRKSLQNVSKKRTVTFSQIRNDSGSGAVNRPISWKIFLFQKGFTCALADDFAERPSGMPLVHDAGDACLQ